VALGVRTRVGALEVSGGAVTESIPLFQRPFYFLRHGETETNAQRLVAGSLDTALTEAGRQQALAAAEMLAGEAITAIYSSPLQRARDTAVPVAAKLELPIIIVADLAERNWGVLEGQPRGSRRRGVTPEGAETSRAFAQRILCALASIDSEAPLIVGHSGVFRVLCRSVGIMEASAPVANALPLRFEPLHGRSSALKHIFHT
jgi:probable phosphoglycerate mutase